MQRCASQRRCFRLSCSSASTTDVSPLVPPPSEWATSGVPHESRCRNRSACAGRGTRSGGSASGARGCVVRAGAPRLLDRAQRLHRVARGQREHRLDDGLLGVVAGVVERLALAENDQLGQRQRTLHDSPQHRAVWRVDPELAELDCSFGLDAQLRRGLAQPFVHGVAHAAPRHRNRDEEQRVRLECCFECAVGEVQKLVGDVRLLLGLGRRSPRRGEAEKEEEPGHSQTSRIGL